LKPDENGTQQSNNQAIKQSNNLNIQTFTFKDKTMKQKHTTITILALILILILGALYLTDATTQEDVVGYWTYDLGSGFTLVTFPVLPNTPTLQAVIGDQLDAVEITTWDKRIGRYRYARYDPDENNWSGDLYLLNRGVGYWINRFDADDQRRLIVKGHPEVYTRFRWGRLGGGWKYYGPTIGKEQELNEVPPENIGDILIGWNTGLNRYELAEGLSQQQWYSPEFDRIQPDRGYLVYQKPTVRTPRYIGPPTNPHADFIDPDVKKLGRDDDRNDEIHYQEPPWPLIVGNNDGMPVCYRNGDVCGSGFLVHVVRERLRIGIGDELEPYAENVDRFEVTDGGLEPGKFRLSLTVSEMEGHLNPGDRVYLLVEGPNHATTRSTSFEIPPDERFIPDIDFPDPLGSSGEMPSVPQSFVLAAPFPNPFNDRFSIEFSLPETAPVEYRMYDLRGREVYNVSRPMSAGQHRLTISAGELSAGIYVLEIKAGGHRGLVKVAHVK